jgi:hypothetical protein
VLDFVIHRISCHHRQAECRSFPARPRPGAETMTPWYPLAAVAAPAFPRDRAPSLTGPGQCEPANSNEPAGGSPKRAPQREPSAGTDYARQSISVRVVVVSIPPDSLARPEGSKHFLIEMVFEGIMVQRKRPPSSCRATSGFP